LPLFGGGFFGTALLSGPTPAAFATAFEAAVYGLALAALYRLQLAPAPAVAADTPPLTRRELLRRAVLAVAAVAVGGGALVALNRREAARGAATNNGRVGNGDLPPEVTPTPSFYEVSKNFVDPHVDAGAWQLAIGGMVERPYTLNLAAIQAMPPVTDYRTLCCISNEVGGDLISNAGWKGVRLKDLLDKAGVKPGAVDLQLTAADGYTESFPIQKALSPEVLAVYEMNGAPLEQAHGYPLRLLVPNIYGMKNVKWVTKMDVVGSDFQGYWEEQGWSDVATVQTMSRLDFPVDGQLVPAGRYRVGGVAFAGSRGIAKVEVTDDGGKTWQEAQLRHPLGPATWVLWTADLDLAPGAYRLTVRATDGTGALQTEKEAPPPPDGATGWHTINVQASDKLKVTPAAGQAAPNPTLAPVRNQGIYSP
ncbi:MAG TPA: molybdopterin-dependent oxidoreductase, partial [Thermomicrobiales bacterium]|nr:molybdopterin-dependent oxidoreductase [Thermomicrobiales bacterium]